MEQVKLYGIPNAEHLQILCIEAGPVATNGYMLIDVQAKQSVIIDAPHQSMQVFTSYANDQDLHLQALWLTHTLGSYCRCRDMC